MKRILLVVAAVIALSLAVFGRDALDLVRLLHFIETSSADYQADGGAWPQIGDVCSTCHGVKGQSQHQAYPSLAGQPAPYVANQLRRFASGERIDATMGPLAMALSAAEVEQLSQYFAKAPAGDNATFEPDPRLQEQGKQLVATRGCAACHGERFMGRDAMPRLAAQGHDYLLAQLEAFASGARSDPTGAMKSLAAAASPEERDAMAHYLASLPANH